MKRSVLLEKGLCVEPASPLQGQPHWWEPEHQDPREGGRGSPAPLVKEGLGELELQKPVCLWVRPRTRVHKALPSLGCDEDEPVVQRLK